MTKQRKPKLVRTQMVCIKPGQGMQGEPHHDTHDYREYVKAQKADGLQRKYWPLLPAMWEKELRRRRDLEAALRRFAF